MTVFNSFADLAQARINLADAREGITESYDGAFLEHSDLAKLNIIEAPIAAEMPDPDMARRAVEMAIGTIFDVLKDTRMEEFAQQLAWGMSALRKAPAYAGAFRSSFAQGAGSGGIEPPSPAAASIAIPECISGTFTLARRALPVLDASHLAGIAVEPAAASGQCADRQSSGWTRPLVGIQPQAQEVRKERGMEETSSDRRQRCSSHSASRISRQSSIRYRLRYARKSSPR